MRANQTGINWYMPRGESIMLITEPIDLQHPGRRNVTDTLEIIGEEVRTCTACDLHHSRVLGVPGEGSVTAEIAERRSRIGMSTVLPHRSHTRW